MQHKVPDDRNPTDGIGPEEVAALTAALGQLGKPTPQYARQLLLAIPYQLEALAEHGVLDRGLVETIFDLQRQRSVLVDAQDNWFTRNLHRFGRGFNLQPLSLDPTMMARKFDRLAVRWEEYVVGCQYRHVFSWLVRCVRTLTPSLRSTGHLLDLACGVGLMGQTLRLARVKGPLTGIDLSAGMLAKAAARDCYDSLLQANVNERLPIPDEQVDVVVCTGAMELLDIGHVLRECHRVLRPGGTLWVSFQYHDGVSPNPTAHQEIVGLTSEEIRDQLERSLFQVLEEETCPTAFLTPAANGSLNAVPYHFVRAERRSESRQSCPEMT